MGKAAKREETRKEEEEEAGSEEEKDDEGVRGIIEKEELEEDTEEDELVGGREAERGRMPEVRELERGWLGEEGRGMEEELLLLM